MFQPYHDVPGIEDNGWLTDHSASLPQYNGANSLWASIDPSLESMRYYDYGSEHLLRMQQHVYNLGQSANGYGQAVPVYVPHREMGHMALDSPVSTDFDPRRHTRHVSPTCYALSARDSSSSEYSYSPDSTRHYGQLSQASVTSSHMYATALFDATTGSGHHSWTAPPLQVRDGSYSPYPSSTTSACNLKEVQYNPDVYLEDESRQLHNQSQPRLLLPDPEEAIFSPETISFADEGLGQSIGDDTSGKEDEDDEAAPETDEDPEYVPHRSARKHPASSRRATMRSPRRHQSLQTPTSPNVILGTESRVSKPSHRRTSSTKSNTRPTSSPSSGNKKIRSFPCTFSHYHCAAVFASKNEWKRHVTSQHLQLGFYRCDVGACSLDHRQLHHQSHAVAYNDFNRKDLFTQHHRRMHWPDKPHREPTKDELKAFDATLEPVRERCWIKIRDMPQKSGCGMCGKVFDGLAGNGWEERMEHVGKHFEKGEGANEREDELLTEWAIAEELVQDLGSKGKWLVGLQPSEKGDGKGAGSRRRTSTRRAGDGEESDEA